MRAAIESSDQVPDRGDLEALPDALAHRRGAGRRVRGARQRRGGLARVARLRHGQGRRLPRRPAGRAADGEEAIDAIYELEHWGLPFNRTPDGQDRPAAVRRAHARTTARRPVKRACYAADRTGHMILQTLYQQCVKRDVRFFNEFYCLDLLLDDDGATRRASSRTSSRPASSTSSARRRSLFATGGYGRMFRVTSNAHTLTGDGPAVAVPARHPARGHGDVPVPPDGPLQARRPAVRGGARRGRHRAEQGRRALHGALRAHDQGPRARATW